MMNDIKIARIDSTGAEVGLLKVPLSYAPKDKMLARIFQDPNHDKESALTLPRMSFEMTNLFYDGDRKLNSIGRVVRKHNTDPTKGQYVYNAVPYNMNFTLYIYVKNAEDGTRIVEQILPFFAPEWSATLNLIPELNISRDVPIVVMSTRSEDSYEDNFEQRRALIWTLDFMMKGFLYGPTITKPFINFANVTVRSATGNVADQIGNTNYDSRVTVQPGLDANGDSTSNLSISIDKDLIEADDDFGYIITPSGVIIKE